MLIHSRSVGRCSSTSETESRGEERTGEESSRSEERRGEERRLRAEESSISEQRRRSRAMVQCIFLLSESGWVPFSSLLPFLDLICL